jgi:abortive infection bacteriophage resistance protein
LGEVNLKKFLTIENQITRIMDMGVEIDNVDKAKKLLEHHSYYNVINGYRRPFLYHGRRHSFIRDTKFEEIFALYDFDRRLRNTLFPILLDVENTLKTEILYEFSKTTDNEGHLLHDGDGYLKLSSYDVNGENNERKIKYTLNLIGDLQKTLTNSFQKSESVDHYLLNYGYVPLWVLGTQITFGTISKFYQSMKQSNRQAISRKYSMSDDDFLTLLKLLALSRNYCAHYNRLYCMKSNILLPTPNIDVYPTQHRFVTTLPNQQALFKVFIALKYFVPKKSFKSLINVVKTSIDALGLKMKVITINDILDIMGFPSDWLTITE